MSSSKVTIPKRIKKPVSKKTEKDEVKKVHGVLSVDCSGYDGISADNRNALGLIGLVKVYCGAIEGIVKTVENDKISRSQLTHHRKEYADYKSIIIEFLRKISVSFKETSQLHYPAPKKNPSAKKKPGVKKNKKQVPKKKEVIVPEEKEVEAPTESTSKDIKNLVDDEVKKNEETVGEEDGEDVQEDTHEENNEEENEADEDAEDYDAEA